MKITLLRHGKPDINIPKKLASNELADFIHRYNAVGVEEKSNPSFDAIQVANTAHAIICSDLARSVTSAKKLTTKPIDVCNAMFKEAELPSASFGVVKLNPIWWFHIYRVLWFLGFSKNGESYTQTKVRARHAAQELTQISQHHGHVLFVGHGVLNYLIAKELKHFGWSGPKKSPTKHWESATYERNL